jgi:hypothetical protein
MQSAHAHGTPAPRRASALRSASSRAKPVWLDQTSRSGRGVSGCGIVARAPTPTQCSAGQRIQRRGESAICDAPVARPGHRFTEMQAQQRPADQRQQDRAGVAEPRARRTGSCALLVEQALEGC